MGISAELQVVSVCRHKHDRMSLLSVLSKYCNGTSVLTCRSAPFIMFCYVLSQSPASFYVGMCVWVCVWPVCWFTGNTRPKEFPRWSQPYLPPIKIHQLQLMILVSSLTEWLDFSWRWSDIVSTAAALRCLYPSSWRNVNLIVTSCFVRNLGKKVWREQSTPVNIVCGISPHTTDQEHCTGVRSNHEQSHDFGTVCFSLFMSHCSFHSLWKRKCTDALYILVSTSAY